MEPQVILQACYAAKQRLEPLRIAINTLQQSLVKPFSQQLRFKKSAVHHQGTASAAPLAAVDLAPFGAVICGKSGRQLLKELLLLENVTDTMVGCSIHQRDLLHS